MRADSQNASRLSEFVTAGGLRYGANLTQVYRSTPYRLD